LFEQRLESKDAAGNWTPSWESGVPTTRVFCFFSYEVKSKTWRNNPKIVPQEKKNLKPAALQYSGLEQLFFSLKLHKRLQVSLPNPQINSSKHPKCHWYYCSNFVLTKKFNFNILLLGRSNLTSEVLNKAALAFRCDSFKLINLCC